MWFLYFCGGLYLIVGMFVYGRWLDANKKLSLWQMFPGPAIILLWPIVLGKSITDKSVDPKDSADSEKET